MGKFFYSQRVQCTHWQKRKDEQMANTAEQDDRVKITIEIPKQLRGAIRLAAARNDRLMSEEIRDTLVNAYGGAEEIASVEV